MSDRTCRLVRERLGEAGGDGLPPPAAEHARGCAACADELARQQRLESLLESLPSAPRVDVPRPSLPRSPAPVLRPVAGWLAAAAAAALVVVATHAGGLGRDAVTTVRVQRVVDLPDAPSPADERLLALTAGVEAVAMRRPTECR